MLESILGLENLRHGKQEDVAHRWENKVPLTMVNKILVVNDEKDIVDLIEEALSKILRQPERHQKSIRRRAGTAHLRGYQPDTTILDVILPDMNGFEVHRKKRKFSYCSILFLPSRSTALSSIPETVIEKKKM